MALDYDNSAFYYFGMTMLGIYVIPTTFWILAYVYRIMMPQQRFSDVARTSVEKAKARELSERQSVTRLLTNARFIINASLLVTAWVVLLMLIRVRYFSN
jgi:translocation protein SEC63